MYAARSAASVPANVTPAIWPTLAAACVMTLLAFAAFRCGLFGVAPWQPLQVLDTHKAAPVAALCACAIEIIPGALLSAPHSSASRSTTPRIAVCTLAFAVETKRVESGDTDTA